MAGHDHVTTMTVAPEYRCQKLAKKLMNISEKVNDKVFFTESREKFQIEINQNYWKMIIELIPNKVPTFQKKGGNKEQDEQTPITLVEGPKLEKPTDLSRTRQTSLKLKHETPIHLKLSISIKEAENLGSTKADKVYLPPQRGIVATKPRTIDIGIANHIDLFYIM